MRYTINHDGFHGYNRFTLRLPAGSKEGDIIQLSPGQVRKINKTVCGIRDCKCYEGINPADPYIILPTDGGEYRGRYPQS